MPKFIHNLAQQYINEVLHICMACIFSGTCRFIRYEITTGSNNITHYFPF